MAAWILFATLNVAQLVLAALDHSAPAKLALFAVLVALGAFLAVRSGRAAQA